MGTAAQGDLQPLMTETVKSMRKWCVPKESAPSEEVGDMLRKMEACPIKEVGAFEGKMVEIGLLNSPVSL